MSTFLGHDFFLFQSWGIISSEQGIFGLRGNLVVEVIRPCRHVFAFKNFAINWDTKALENPY